MDLHNFDYLTPKEVGEMLGVHHDSIRRWIRCGKLKAYKVKDGGRFFIKRSDITEMLKPVSV